MAFRIVCAAILACVFCAAPQARASRIKKGLPPAPVQDAAGMLTVAQHGALSRELRTHREQTGLEILVVTVPDLKGRSIEEYAASYGKEWGDLSKATEEGILYVVAPKERRARIALGRRIDVSANRSIARRIMEGVIVPRFKEGKMEDGVLDGARAIIAAEWVDKEAVAAKLSSDWRMVGWIVGCCIGGCVAILGILNLLDFLAWRPIHAMVARNARAEAEQSIRSIGEMDSATLSPLMRQRRDDANKLYMALLPVPEPGFFGWKAFAAKWKEVNAAFRHLRDSLHADSRIRFFVCVCGSGSQQHLPHCTTRNACAPAYASSAQQSSCAGSGGHYGTYGSSDSSAGSSGGGDGGGCSGGFGGASGGW